MGDLKRNRRLGANRLEERDFFSTPVLFLIFNRPAHTERVFTVIRAAKPPVLYIAADGPRPDASADVALTRQARQIVTQVDWPCKVRTLFRDRNLGCRDAVSSAISWFFENEEFGIVLEDDCLPDISFFWFCEDMLLKYRHDDRVWHVGGSNPVARYAGTSSTYSFSAYNRIWGWASWARAWKNYDPKISGWPGIRDSGVLHSLLGRVEVRKYSRIFEDVYRSRIDTWDYQWFLSRLMGGIAVVPAVNLVSNIGFDETGTHTRASSHSLANRPTGSYRRPPKHPPEVRVKKWGDFLWSFGESKRTLMSDMRAVLKKLVRP